MADFHQNGNIAQFHNLRARPLDELVYELEAFSQTRKISLILPSLYSELEGEALPNILDELAKVPYLHRIIIGLDQADEDQFRHARQFFSRLPQNHVVLWNDSPRMKEIGARLDELGLAPFVLRAIDEERAEALHHQQGQSHRQHELTGHAARPESHQSSSRVTRFTSAASM